MKKIIILLALLVILAGVAFYFGWIQIRLRAGTYAVIFTKTGGWDEKVTEPGVFSWRWERLLPTNMEIHYFELEPYTSRLAVDGSLPSAADYREIIDPAPQFDFSVSITVSYTIKPEALPQLVSENRLTQDTTSEWFNNTNELLAARTSQFIREASERPGFASDLGTTMHGLDEALKEKLARSLPEAEIQSVVINNFQVPDMDLYHTAKELYLEFARQRKESFAAALAEITWTESRAEQHFTVLEEYGELITKYPMILELFSLKEGNLETILEDIDAFSPDESSFGVIID